MATFSDEKVSFIKLLAYLCKKLNDEHMSSGRRHLLSPLEQFSMAPLMAVLPKFEGAQNLEAFGSSLFARYEQVNSAKNEATDANVSRALASEAAMLRQALEWLNMKPE